MVPHRNEHGTRAFLKQLPVNVLHGRYDNDDTYSAKDVKQAPRPAGKANVEFNDQPGEAPLKNYGAVDSKSTNEATKIKIKVKSDSAKAAKKALQKLATPNSTGEESIASNEELELNEGPTRKHFRDVAATVAAISDPHKRQEYADHHAAIFARQNPRFDFKKWHAACCTQSHVYPDKNKASWGK